MRPPDEVIGGAEAPYLRRWWLIPRNRFLNLYLHQFLRSDDERALHDHPWWSISLLLRGRYAEHFLDGGARHRRFPALVLRSARMAHRIALVDGAPCWTLFLTGPKIRAWGFHCPNGWRPWQVFCNPQHSGAIGRGCE